MRPSEVYKVICREAQKVRAYMNPNETPEYHFDVVRCLEAFRYNGECQLVILPDSRRSQKARIDLAKKTVYLTEGTYARACNGDLLDRFIIAHEIGHLMLHCDTLKTMTSAAFDNKTQEVCREQEASLFASKLFTAEEVAEIYAQLADIPLADIPLAETPLADVQLAEEELSASDDQHDDILPVDSASVELTCDEDRLAEVPFEFYFNLSNKAKNLEKRVS